MQAWIPYPYPRVADPASPTGVQHSKNGRNGANLRLGWLRWAESSQFMAGIGDLWWGGWRKWLQVAGITKHAGLGRIIKINMSKPLMLLMITCQVSFTFESEWTFAKHVSCDVLQFDVLQWQQQQSCNVCNGNMCAMAMSAMACNSSRIRYSSRLPADAEMELQQPAAKLGLLVVSLFSLRFCLGANWWMALNCLFWGKMGVLPVWGQIGGKTDA